LRMRSRRSSTCLCTSRKRFGEGCLSMPISVRQSGPPRTPVGFQTAPLPSLEHNKNALVIDDRKPYENEVAQITANFWSITVRCGRTRNTTR
jgi:hypothetical protein